MLSLKRSVDKHQNVEEGIPLAPSRLRRPRFSTLSAKKSNLEFHSFAHTVIHSFIYLFGVFAGWKKNAKRTSYDVRKPDIYKI